MSLLLLFPHVRTRTIPKSQLHTPRDSPMLHLQMWRSHWRGNPSRRWHRRHVWVKRRTSERGARWWRGTSHHPERRRRPHERWWASHDCVGRGSRAPESQCLLLSHSVDKAKGNKVYFHLLFSCRKISPHNKQQKTLIEIEAVWKKCQV